jgi:hypothetical protein
MLPLLSSECEKREDFGIMLTNRGLINTIVEVGVDRGEFSVALLNNWKGQKYYGIDPWSDKHNYGIFAGKDRTRDYNEAAARIQNANDETEKIILRGTSESEIDKIPNEIDFAYIDGNHYYEFVKKDINLFWPKIKQGGILAGHDWNGDWQWNVATAVIEKFQDTQIYYMLGPAASWYVIKE